MCGCGPQPQSLAKVESQLSDLLWTANPSLELMRSFRIPVSSHPEEKAGFLRTVGQIMAPSPNARS